MNGRPPRLCGIVGACLLVMLAISARAQDESVLVELPDAAGGYESIEESPIDDQGCMEALRECCGCPQWSRYAVFDALFLQRSNQTGNQPIVLNKDSGQAVMTTGNLDPTIGTGFRTFYGALSSDRYGWEIGYMGLWGMFGEAKASDPRGNLRTPGILDVWIDNFGDAHDARAMYLSSLNMAEINVFRYAAHEECRQSCTGTSCTGCDNCSRSCHYLHTLLGFVWAGLNERAELDMTCCPTNETASYNVRTSTNYFGAQVGMQGRREWRRWAVEGWWKTALCGVNASQNSDPIVSTVSKQYRPAQSASVSGIGFIGKLNGTLVYLITDVWGLRCGYNLIWLTDAALAPSQWDFSGLDGGAGINNNGTVFLHGANLGFEARW